MIPHGLWQSLLPVLLILCSNAPRCDAALRLRVNGSQILDPSGQPIVLTGFNWVLSANHTREGEGKFMKSVLPGTNLVRLVGVLWDNDPQPGSGDCMTDQPPNYFDDACFKKLDWLVAQATAAKIWVILTMRGAVAATDVFNNAQLAARLQAMWAHVAAHYRGTDNIAAYELMSEPRDKSATPDQVRAFYEGACAAALRSDPATPCLVGPGPYYKLWRFDETMLLQPRNGTSFADKVIYTFDYFLPERYSFGKEQMPLYPATYECKDLYRGCSAEEGCCTAYPKGGNTPIGFNRTYHERNLDRWPVALRAAARVPVFMNQWGVVHGIDAAHGRYAFMADVAAALRARGIGWAWWVWRGGGGGANETWKHGSMEFVYEHADGTVDIDKQAVAAVKPFM